MVVTFVSADGPHSRPAAIAITVGRVGVVVGALIWVAGAAATLLRHHRTRR